VELHVRHSDLALILAHAHHDLPDEACGVLGGVFEGGVAVVRQIIPVKNTAVDPRHRFDMEAKAMVRAILRLRRSGLEVVGLYHSHPESSAEPSPTDIAEATWMDVAHLIVGRAATMPYVRAWAIRTGQAHPALLIVTLA
jgi:proteasome lid subunit RPN8/RPN11